MHALNSASENLRFFQKHSVLRRITFVFFYELIAIIFTLLILEKALGHGGAISTLTAVLISLTAVTWNYIWNTIFEFFERRLKSKGRNFYKRLIHAVGFEGFLIVFTVPLTAFLLKITLVESFFLQAGLLLFFFIFTYVYAWAFDRIFGLPASAR